MRLRAGGVNGPIVWRAPLQREQWNDFVLHVKWSSDPKVGFVELYHNGKLALPQRKVATQFSGQRNYLKLGLYRNETISPEGVVFHDGFTVATDLADVLPPMPQDASAAVY
jgi:Polysaccharide lyase